MPQQLSLTQAMRKERGCWHLAQRGSEQFKIRVLDTYSRCIRRLVGRIPSICQDTLYFDVSHVYPERVVPGWWVDGWAAVEYMYPNVSGCILDVFRTVIRIHRNTHQIHTKYMKYIVFHHLGASVSGYIQDTLKYTQIHVSTKIHPKYSQDTSGYVLIENPRKFNRKPP